MPGLALRADHVNVAVALRLSVRALDIRAHMQEVTVGVHHRGDVDLSLE